MREDQLMGPPYRRAIVRPPGDSYAQCIRPPGETESIDIALAHAQHDAYTKVIASQGIEIERLEPDARFPDGCFVEDSAIVVPGRAAICSSGAPSRRGEERTVATALGIHMATYAIEDPATIDGGDVLRIADRLFVGVSERTNAAALERLGEIVEPAGVSVTPVEMTGILHLKSGCTWAGNDAVLISSQYVDPGAFKGYRQLEVPPEEGYAANCLTLGDVVVVSGGYPRTRELLEESGFETIALEMSEFRKGWGSLTCLSILF